MADLFWVRVPRDFVRVSGPDATTFLQGQISQDIEAVRARGSAWSFLLQPQGKVDAWVRVSTHGDDEYVLDVDGGFGEAVIARLNRFKLRVKVDIDPLDWQCVAVRGDGAAAVDGLAAEWPGIEAVDVVGPDPAVDFGRPATLDDYERARIEAGVPAMGSEITTSDDPGRARRERSLGELHEGVLHRPGARGESRLARWQRPPPSPAGAGRRRRARRGAGRARRPRGRVAHERRRPTTVGTIALAIVARSVEPPAAVVVRADDAELVAHVTALPTLAARERESGLHGRQPHDHAGAATRRALRGDRAAHRLDELAHDREAEPRPGLSAHGFVARHVEPLEDVGEILGRDARAVVVDDEHRVGARS